MLYNIKGELNFTLFLSFTDKVKLNDEQAVGLNIAIEDAVADSLNGNAEDIYLCEGNFKDGDEIDTGVEYEFGFICTVYGSAEETPDVLYLANGDPGYPGDYEEMWDSAPNDLDLTKVENLINNSYPNIKTTASYVYFGEIGKVERYD